MKIRDLMQTNVYVPRGRIAILGSCLQEMYPEAFKELISDADQAYSLCLESVHLNMAVTKLGAILATGQVNSVCLATVDRSPHCTQMHYMMHEIERTMPVHAPCVQYVVTERGISRIDERVVEASKSLEKLSAILKTRDAKDKDPEKTTQL